MGFWGYFKAAQSRVKAKYWRQMVVELSARIQKCKGLNSTEPESFHLQELAREAMEEALEFDDD